MFNDKLVEADLYKLTIFNWTGGASTSAFNGKFCIELNGIEGQFRYLSNDLTVKSIAGECWYSPDVIVDMLRRLSRVRICECCGQIIEEK